MNSTPRFVPLLSLVLLLPVAGAVLIAAGCASEPRRGYGYGGGGRADVVIGEDDYDYYPAYEVYYSRRHRDYYYRDGQAWVRRPAPPRGFQRGPFVPMTFHDAPDHHHPEIIKTYPRTWRPNVQNDSHPNDRRGDDRRDDNPPRDRR